MNWLAWYGIAIAATSMLSMTGIIVAIDATAQSLTTLAVSLKWPVCLKTSAISPIRWMQLQHHQGCYQGYAIGSAGLAALVLFADYTHALSGNHPNLTFDLSIIW